MQKFIQVGNGQATGSLSVETQQLDQLAGAGFGQGSVISGSERCRWLRHGLLKDVAGQFHVRLDRLSQALDAARQAMKRRLMREGTDRSGNVPHTNRVALNFLAVPSSKNNSDSQVRLRPQGRLVEE